MSKISITWRVCDGYAGGDRPHHTRLGPDMFDLDMTDDELAEQVAEVVQEDYDNRIGLDLRSDDVAAAVKAIRAAAAAKSAA